MRFAFLLVCLPVLAMAQPAATTKPADAPRKSSAAKPAAPAGSAKPSAGAHSSKPAAAAHPPAKPGNSTKPNPHKPASAGRKPVAPVAPPAAAVVAPAVVAPPAEPTKGSATGLPLPRFAALRSDDVNFRSGPGTRYPIDWVYKRRDLPVQIEREFEIWRLVRDPQGNKGWVNQATLTGRRTAVTVGAEHTLRGSASDTAATVATLKPGVILRVRSCEASSEWCQAQIGDYRGFIRRSDIWGVLPGEVIQ